MYEKIQAVTKQKVNECLVNDLKHCVKETKHWYDRKHCCDVSFYSVDDYMFLASPTTHSSISLDGRELGTKNGRWQACRRVFD